MLQPKEWLLISLSLSDVSDPQEEGKLCFDARKFILTIESHHSSKATGISALPPENTLQRVPGEWCLNSS